MWKDASFTEYQRQQQHPSWGRATPLRCTVLGKGRPQWSACFEPPDCTHSTPTHTWLALWSEMLVHPHNLQVQVAAALAAADGGGVCVAHQGPVNPAQRINHQPMLHNASTNVAGTWMSPGNHPELQYSNHWPHASMLLYCCALQHQEPDTYSIMASASRQEVHGVSPVACHGLDEAVHRPHHGLGCWGQQVEDLRTGYQHKPHVVQCLTLAGLPELNSRCCHLLLPCPTDAPHCISRAGCSTYAYVIVSQLPWQ
jgi:hypothetical protein